MMDIKMNKLKSAYKKNDRLQTSPKHTLWVLNDLTCFFPSSIDNTLHFNDNGLWGIQVRGDLELIGPKPSAGNTGDKGTLGVISFWTFHFLHPYPSTQVLQVSEVPSPHDRSTVSTRPSLKNSGLAEKSLRVQQCVVWDFPRQGWGSFQLPNDVELTPFK